MDPRLIITEKNNLIENYFGGTHGGNVSNSCCMLISSHYTESIHNPDSPYATFPHNYELTARPTMPPTAMPIVSSTTKVSTCFIVLV